MSAALLVAYAFMAGFITKTNTPPESFYTSETLVEEYDFIVVGGGTAGCLVANRLSADCDVTVLVIEAGGVENDLTEIPLFGILHLGSPYDWKYKTVPQKDGCQALNNKVSTWNRGKILGGTSVINFMTYVRGNKHDFNQWEQDGADGWSYKDVLPYFKNIENFTVTDENSEYHGYRGELPVTEPAPSPLLGEVVLESCNELGYGRVDYNGETQRGCSKPQVNTKNGRRVSSSKAFIRPVLEDRSNLHITLHSHVTKILFEGKKAVGVVFEKDGNNFTVKAKKEIILSAGTIGSPHILLLSGVGPKDHLDEMKIPLVADLPVGKNLQDHVGIGGLAATTDKEAGMDASSAATYIEYGVKATGPLESPGGVVITFMNTKYANDSFPDVELMFTAGSPARPAAERLYTGAGLKQEIYNDYYLPKRGQPGYMVLTVLNRPKSRGTITLNSTDPKQHPIIDPKYFSHPEDVDGAVEAAKLALNAMNTTVMQEKLGSKLWDISFPECKGQPYGDEYLKCLVKQQTLTGWHYVGTCKMGCDKEAVVDTRLRVRGGVQNLRVVDGSIMPSIVTGNVMAAIYMIAAKGADMILEDNGLPTFVSQKNSGVPSPNI